MIFNTGAVTVIVDWGSNSNFVCMIFSTGAVTVLVNRGGSSSFVYMTVITGAVTGLVLNSRLRTGRDGSGRG